MLGRWRAPAGWARHALLAAVLSLCAGCISLPTGPHPPAETLPPVLHTGLGADLAPFVAAHPGESGIALLQHGPAALLARAVLADLATQTIDVQYYIYEDDLSGLLLTQKLLDAADRGVRVRVLLDDNNLRGSDAGLKLLASHPNISIRVFNPYRTRVRWLRPIELLADFRRLHRRMHNKIFAVDGITGIFGGRNIGDNYFDASKGSNFSDFDVFVAGKLIIEATASFEEYWVHRLALPADRLTPKAISSADFEAGRRYLRERLAAVPEIDQRYDRAREQLVDFIHAPEQALTWARAEFVVDPPDKLVPGHDGGSPVLDRLGELWGGATGEVLIESAYFVPTQEGARFMMQRAQAGVRTRLLTNSLAANDVLPVHAGYAKYRRRLLKAGVEIHEFQRRAAHTAGSQRLSSASSDASLHAKVLVFDRTVTWVGSFNLDPRSAELNTELAIIIHDSAIGQRAAAMVERDLQPDRAWRLVLEPRKSGGLGLVWYGERDGATLRLTEEPDASRGQRAAVNLLKLVPGLEGLL
jgi:cardiolipin synthase C